MKQILLAFAYVCSLFLLGSFLSSPVFASTELIITDNGGGSVSEVTVNQDQNTQVHQDNQAAVENSVKVGSNTGANTASDNSGATSITTGNSQTETSVTNTLNSNQQTSGCCTDVSGNSTQAAVVGNGRDSQNTIVVDHSSNNLVSQTNTAHINNTFQIHTNTGSNNASDNSGSVSIQTGDSNVATKVINITNSNFVGSYGSPLAGGIKKIGGNGEGSKNQIEDKEERNEDTYQTNTFDITNTLDTSSNTGGNEIGFNTGQVSMSTGDSIISADVINTANISQTGLADCSPDAPSYPDDSSSHGASNPPPASLPTSNSSGGSSSESLLLGGTPSGGVGEVDSSGEILGISSAGQILPATGGLMTLLLTIFSVLMFVLGLYLRMHPGIDPGRVVYA